MSEPRPTDPPTTRLRAAARGFTLIELLTTMAVLVVTLTLAAPALSGFIRGNRLTSAQSELTSSFALARSEAVRRGVAVGLEAKAEAAAGGFARGWRVWIDANGNGAYDSGEERLRDVADFGTSVGIATTGDARDIVFSPRGFLAAAALVEVKLCGPASEPGARAYVLLVEPVGLVDASEKKRSEMTGCPS